MLLEILWALLANPVVWFVFLAIFALYVIALAPLGPREKRATRWMLLGLLLSALTAGCTHITYQTADGASVTVSRCGYDTKLGKLSAGRTADGSVYVDVENLDSEARAIDLAKSALDLAGGAAKGGLP
jgi:hypothetical protein